MQYKSLVTITQEPDQRSRELEGETFNTVKNEFIHQICSWSVRNSTENFSPLHFLHSLYTSISFSP